MAILGTVTGCESPGAAGHAGIDLLALSLAPDPGEYEAGSYDVYEYEYNGYYAEPEVILPPDPGELDLQRETVFVAGRYAGFLTWGYFRHSSVDEPIVVVESSVKDTYTDAELGIWDIIDYEMMDKALSLLAEAILARAPEAAPYLHMIDAGWLTHLVMGHEGLRVLLTPDTAPWDLCFMYVDLPYEDLDEAFLLWVELGLREPPRRPMVALTFDDGPSKYTDMILDMLEAVGGRATFCVLGNLVHQRPETLIRAVALGSEVIGHSWDHSDFTRLNASAISTQITRTSEAIEAIIGFAPPPLVRVPFGEANNRVFNVAYDLGYSLLHWSVDPQDWLNRCPDWIYYYITKRVVDGSIVLLHDIRTTTAEAMLHVIPRLIEDGFQLVTASELIEYHYGGLVPGERYKGHRPPWGVTNQNWARPYS